MEPVKTEVIEETEVPETEQELGPPKIAKVLYDYEANLDDDITVHENENVVILDDTDPDWWKVRVVSKNGQEGMVPKTYIEVMVPGQSSEENEMGEVEETYENSVNINIKYRI